MSETLDSRHNNFDLLRLIAALAVLYGHSFFEATDNAGDIVARLSGKAEYSASVAVYAFFLISGIMISASLERHRSAVAFVMMRFFRIWPGFLACCAVILYILIPLSSDIGWHDRLYAKQAIACLRQNALFFFKDYCGTLTGVFPMTPMPDAFGFVFWSLVAEVHCYGVALILGAAMRYRISTTPGRRMVYCAAAAATGILYYFVATTSLRPQGFEAEFTILGGYSSYPVLFFFGGMACYALRHVIVLDGVVAVTLAATTALLEPLHVLLYPILSYALLVVASIKALNRFAPPHDVSFGIYIYGTALLQMTASYDRTAPARIIFLVSATLTLGLAMLSWLLVERPSIRAGRWLARTVSRSGVETASG